MKSIPTGIKIFFCLLWILPAGKTGYSQQGPYLGSSGAVSSFGPGGSINIVVPSGTGIVSWDNAVLGGIRRDTVYSLWLEKGDGNYVSNFSSGYGAISIPSSSCNVGPVLYATQLYEHKRRPPTTSSVVAVNAIPAPQPGKMSSAALTSGQVILFTNNRVIVDSDYVVAAISYAPKFSQQENIYEYRLVFRYNSNEKNTFFPITDALQTTSIMDYNGHGPVQVKDIRKFGTEAVSLTNNAAELKGYHNGVVFEGIRPGNDTFNIFISLLAKGRDDLPAQSNMEVELQYRTDKGSAWISRETSVISNIQSATAHDPNSISVSPTCLSLPQTKQTLHYTINFQNTGKGPADAVMVAFYIPGQMNIAKKIWNLKASYSDIPNYVITNINYDWAKERIIFKLDPTSDVLDGTRDVPYPVSNPKTMGQLSFDLQVLPGSYPNSPGVLEAWAEIYFHGKEGISGSAITQALIDDGIVIPGTLNYEMPVRTSNAVTIYSACCDGVVDNSCTSSACAWLHCYWWVILIILLIFVLWWLYKRSRRRA